MTATENTENIERGVRGCEKGISAISMFFAAESYKILSLIIRRYTQIPAQRICVHLRSAAVHNCPFP